MGKHEPAEISDAPKKKGVNPNAIIALFLILVGLGVLLYPVVATQWNNHTQSSAADDGDAFTHLDGGKAQRGSGAKEGSDEREDFD